MASNLIPLQVLRPADQGVGRDRAVRRRGRAEGRPGQGQQGAVAGKSEQRLREFRIAGITEPTLGSLLSCHMSEFTQLLTKAFAPLVKLFFPDRRQRGRPDLLRHHRPVRRTLREQRQEVLRLRRRPHLGRAGQGRRIFNECPAHMLIWSAGPLPWVQLDHQSHSENPEKTHSGSFAELGLSI